MWLLLFYLTFISSLVIASGTIQSPPRIKKQSEVDEIPFLSENKDKPLQVIIECQAEGEPEPQYLWTKNGQPFDWQTYGERIFQQTGRGSIVILSPKDEDQGRYQCFAKNKYGIATSNVVSLRKAELHSFKVKPPKIMRIIEGNPVKLHCNAPSGWPKPIIHWNTYAFDGTIKSINDSRITVDPAGNLCFSSVAREDTSSDFYYVCSAISLFQNEYKLGNKIQLNVIPINIPSNKIQHEVVRQYVSKANEIAQKGKIFELFCIFGGIPLPNIEWTKNGRTIPWSDRIVLGNNGKSLIIKKITRADAGSYTCKASNGIGKEDSHSMNVDVQAAPSFIVEPEFVTTSEEMNVTFRCEATGIPQPTIQWIYNGKLIQEAPVNDRRNINQTSLTIQGTVIRDTGNYGCNASNSLGYVYKEVYLNIFVLPPEIVKAPGQVMAINQKTVIMICHVFGMPQPEIKWSKSNQELSNDRFNTLENGNLEIKNVQFTDAGEYICQAKNNYGEVTAVGYLVVKNETKIIEPPHDSQAAIGASVTFICNAIADKSLDIEINWLFNGDLIDPEIEENIIKSNDNSLIISKIKDLNSGIYTCVAATILDEARAEAKLIVLDVAVPL